MPIEDAIAIAAGDVPGAADYLAKAAAAARLMRKRAAPGLADSLRDVAMTGLAGAGLGAAGLGGLGLVQGKSRRQVRNMALAGAPLLARFEGRKSGHGTNNALLRALFSDSGNYQVTEA